MPSAARRTTYAVAPSAACSSSTSTLISPGSDGDFGPPTTDPASAGATSPSSRQLKDLGVDQFAGYLQHDNKEETLRVYGETIIPALREHVDGEGMMRCGVRLRGMRLLGVARRAAAGRGLGALQGPRPRGRRASSAGGADPAAHHRPGRCRTSWEMVARLFEPAAGAAGRRRCRAPSPRPASSRWGSPPSAG